MFLDGVSADSSAVNLDGTGSYYERKGTDHERRVMAFNQKRPWPKGYVQNRVASWSDPISARGILNADDGEEESRGERRNPKSSWARRGTTMIREEGEGYDGEESDLTWAPMRDLKR